MQFSVHRIEVASGQMRMVGEVSFLGGVIEKLILNSEHVGSTTGDP